MLSRVDDSIPADQLPPFWAFQEAAHEARVRARAVKDTAGLRFPWGQVDALVGILAPGMLVALGGRGKQGKSTFLRECFDIWVGTHQKKIMYIGTEQSVGETRALWACQVLALPPEAINLPEHQDAILDDIETRQGALAERGLIYVPDHMDLDTLAQLTHLAAYEKCDAVIFDHFTRLDLQGKHAKWQESGDAIKAVKRMARTERILVIVGAQLTDGDGAFGLHDVPTGASWAYTKELQRECDVGLAIWRPLTRSPTVAERVAARSDLSLVHRLVDPHVMAVRVVAHRLRGDSAMAQGCRLHVRDGRIFPS